MNENLPVHVANSLSEVGSISYANEVIAIIAGMAASEIDGVAEMGTASSSIVDILGRSKKPVTKGVKVEVGSEEASVDLTLSVDYGKPIQKVCGDVQESVRKSIETMTGLHVVKVDVHVQGVSFEREAKALAEGMQRATIDTAPDYAMPSDIDHAPEDVIDQADDLAMNTDIPDDEIKGEDVEATTWDQPEADLSEQNEADMPETEPEETEPAQETEAAVEEANVQEEEVE